METIDLTITDVAYRGKGIARHDGCVVFIPGTITGETVKARITTQKKNFAEAELLSLTQASPFRTEPVCPLFNTCPGCTYQHIDYSEEVNIKHAQLKSMICRAVGNPDIPIKEPVASPASIAYRNKIMLHAEVGSTVKLGYYGYDNRTVLDIPECPLAMNEINELLKTIRAKENFMKSLRSRTSVTLRYTSENGAVSWRGPGSEERLMENTRLGPIRVPRNSFFQVNPAVADILIDIVQNILAEVSTKNVIDLYCGVGIFAIAAAQKGTENVLGIDSNDSAIRAAYRNAVKLGFNNIMFIHGQAEVGLDQALKPVEKSETTLIVDPPRTGLDKDVIKAITASMPAHVIYVSCAADTLARDLGVLTKAGYNIVSTQLVDMFPRTPYFESVTHMSVGD